MGIYFENFNIRLKEDEYEKLIGGLAQEVLAKGRALRTYRGNGGYVNYEYNSMQIVLSIEGKENVNELTSFDMQAASSTIWDVRVNIPELYKKGDTKAVRRVAVKRVDNGTGTADISIINPDTLPSYAENEVLTLQMAAFPEYIEYYPNLEAFEEVIPVAHSKFEFIDGKKLIPSAGVMFPSGLFSGEKNNEDGQEDVIEKDLMVFNAIVKTVNKEHTFHDCGWYYAITVDTQFGELTIVHEEDLVPEKEREYIAPGAVIYCACHLVGDPALFEFAQGAVFNEENDLKLMRHVCSLGQAYRMRNALAEGIIFTTKSSTQTYTGPDEVIDRFDYVNANGAECHALLGTIIASETDDTRIGRRCLALSYEDEDFYDSLLLIKTDDEGKMSSIEIVRPDGYTFEPDDREFMERERQAWLTPDDDSEESGEDSIAKLRRILLEKLRTRTMGEGMDLLQGLAYHEKKAMAEKIIEKIENCSNAEEVRRALDELREHRE